MEIKFTEEELETIVANYCEKILNFEAKNIEVKYNKFGGEPITVTINEIKTLPEPPSQKLHHELILDDEIPF